MITLDRYLALGKGTTATCHYKNCGKTFTRKLFAQKHCSKECSWNCWECRKPGHH